MACADVAEIAVGDHVGSLRSVRVEECPQLVRLHLPDATLPHATAAPLQLVSIRECPNLPGALAVRSAGAVVVANCGITVLSLVGGAACEAIITRCSALTEITISRACGTVSVNDCAELISVDVSQCAKVTSVSLAHNSALQNIMSSMMLELHELSIWASPLIRSVPISRDLQKLDIRACGALATLPLLTCGSLQALKVIACASLVEVKVAARCCNIMLHNCPSLVHAPSSDDRRSVSVFECPAMQSHGV